MIEFYPYIRLVHIASVIASGSLFVLRGLLTLASSRLPMHPAVRYLSYGIDTVLLTAALMLLSVLHLNPLSTPWLATKLLLLPVYVVLGTIALKRARSRRAQVMSFCLALLVLGTMALVARAHDPLGPLRMLRQG